MLSTARDHDTGRRRGRSLQTGRRTPRAVALLALAAAVTVITAGLLSSAAASPPIHPFSYDDATNCHYETKRSLADPIGVVFRGDSASVDNVARQITVHTPWNYGYGGGRQGAFVRSITGNYRCDANQDERAQNDGDEQSRNHIRLWRAHTEEGNVNTGGTPHYDEYVQCGVQTGHAVIEYPGTTASGYDLTRRALRGLFMDEGHRVDVVNWGNSDRMRQCDDAAGNPRRTGSSGAVLIIQVNHQDG